MLCPVPVTDNVSLGNLAATAVSTLVIAGILPTPHISVSPLDSVPSAIADVDKQEPEVNLISPFTMPTVTLFSNK